ncbi:UNVERIFIED_CONTAM: Retrovirus-related Pol polyprotein from transposon RE1 [Sesamum radiatum]|uniref:Retrovirus-related Pol polyprotein from transposon RE1 n=1 Tax=Sesamum radiatum TaxID=300843 RepID=A0AAW2KL50_SESRA
MIASNSRIRTDLESSPSIENSGLTLVSAPLTGDNYLVWSSVSKEIVDAFIYATSARALWLELEARYGGSSNGPMIYNLEREISSISQVCICTAHRQAADRGIASTNEVEKELQVQVHLPDTNNGVVYQLQHRDSRKDKRAMFCEHCRKSGHLKETCFKLHGTPEWKMMMIEENTSLHQMRTPLDNNIRINFARLEELDEAAGNPYCFNVMDCGSWIVDTGATRHDLRTKESLAIGKLEGQLYFLDYNSFSVNTASNNTVSVNVASYSVSHSETNDSASLWHMRLGHSPFDALTHIPSIKFKQASLPDKFWGDCVLTATYLVNRTPFKLLNWLTPYELLHSQPPSYAHLRVFGCLCFAANTKPHRAKFDKCSSKCVFLSYPPGQKGFKLFDLISQTYLVSRDVVFYENVFPFSDSPTSRSSCPLPIILDPIDASIQYPASPSFPSPVGSPTPHTADFSPPISNPITTSPVQPSLLHPNQAPRRSTRHISKPQWLTDFICHYTNQSHITDLMPSYECFVASLSTLQEPHSYKQAIGKPEWEDTMHQELLALDKNHTWEVTTLPPGKKAIGCRWVAGVDYVDCFSPVAKAVTVRLFLAIASAHSWHLHQLDVNNAFLHGYLDEEIFMLPPEGYDVPQGHVCKLKRSLYGLKQASRQWNQEFTSQLVAFGFTQSSHDHCLFVMGSEDTFVAMLIYVDDVLITSPSVSLLTDVKSYLDGLFTIKDLGVALYFLGLQIARSPTGTSVTQAKYINDIVRDMGLMHAKSVTTPFPQHIKLSATRGAVLSDPEPYRRLVGRLLYLGFTRPDISYGVQQLSQFLQHPCESYWHAALHVVRYLKGTSTTGLFFPCSSSFQLQAYCDADWASCVDSRKSISGFCVFFGTSLISWKSKKQATVSRSSAEAEYRSMGATVCELLWISYLLQDFGIPLHSPIPLFCDNKAALHIMANPVFHERTKHLDIDCHIVRNQYKLGFVAPSFVRGKEQIADIFTKSLPASTFLFLLSKLALFSLDPSPPCGGSVGIQAVAATKSGDNDAEAVVCLLDAG